MMTYSTGLSNLQNLPKRTRKINNVFELYEYAEFRGYDIYRYNLDLDGLDSISVTRLSDGKCFIALDPFKFQSSADELVKGLHEIGHCDTGSFYNEYSPCDIRQKHENQADKRAIELRFSKEDLEEAVKKGHTEIWELAEHFGVTEEFMRKAICWYKYGTLATELYF
ncbi:MAG: ImmA/IrrE family metallo-endopeptidase [Oscillospiraceae bacterium]